MENCVGDLNSNKEEALYCKEGNIGALCEDCDSFG